MIFSIGPFVILGTIFGSKITKSDDDKKEGITRYKKIITRVLHLLFNEHSLCNHFLN